MLDDATPGSCSRASPSLEWRRSKITKIQNDYDEGVS